MVDFSSKLKKGIPHVKRPGTHKMTFLQKGQDIKLDELKSMSQEWWKERRLEGKVDGARALYYQGRIVSYNNKPFFNLKPLVTELNDLCEGFVLDGELFQNSWEETMSIIKSSKTLKILGSMGFHLFDVLTLKEFLSGICDVPLRERLERVEQIFRNAGQHPRTYLRTITSFNVSKYEEFLIAKGILLKQRYEGVMIKRLEAPYSFYRHSDWLKWKPTLTVDVKVVGLNRGKGKYTKMLGSFLCTDLFDGQTRLVNVSGMTDDIREEAWKHQRKYMKKIIEVSYVKRTKNGTLYGAQFQRLRIDKVEV